MARTAGILRNGDADDATDGTARADLYVGCREKFIMLARLGWHLPKKINQFGLWVEGVVF